MTRDVLGPVGHLGFGPFGPGGDEGIEVGEEGAEEEGGGAALGIQPVSIGELLAALDVAGIHLHSPRADAGNGGEGVVAGAVVRKDEFDQAFELERWAVPGVGESLGERASAGRSDRVHGARAAADGVLTRAGVPVQGELLGLFEQLALRARPRSADAAVHRLGELVCRVRAHREEAEHAVRRGGEPWKCS